MTIANLEIHKILIFHSNSWHNFTGNKVELAIFHFYFRVHVSLFFNTFKSTFKIVLFCLFLTDVTVLSRRGPNEGPRSIANVPSQNSIALEVSGSS